MKEKDPGMLMEGRREERGAVVPFPKAHAGGKHSSFRFICLLQSVINITMFVNKIPRYPDINIDRYYGDVVRRLHKNAPIDKRRRIFLCLSSSSFTLQGIN